MSDSQKFIARNRAPRVQIEYDVELYGAEKKVQLPFVMGVMSDLSGKSEQPPVSDRNFLEIDVDNFDDRMKAMAPKAQFSVPNTLTGEGNLAVDLTFEKMSDFSPEAIAEKTDSLRPLLEARRQLTDLMAYMDGKSGAETLIENLLTEPVLLKALSGDIEEGTDMSAALESLRAAMPAASEAANKTDATLASLAADAPAEAAPDTSTDDALSTLSPPPEDVETDDHAAALDALKSAPMPEEIETDISSDVLAGIERVEQAREDDQTNAILSGIDVTIEDAEDTSHADALSSIDTSITEKPEEPENEIADVLSGIEAITPEPEDAADLDDVLASVEAIETPDENDTTIDDTLASIDTTLSEVSVETDSKFDDVISSIEAVAEEAEETDPEHDIADALASIDTSVVQNTSDVEDSIKDVLSTIEPVAEGEPTQQTQIDAALGSIDTADANETTPEDTSLDDALSSIDITEPIEAKDTSLSDALASIEAVDAPEEEDTLDDVLSNLESVEEATETDTEIDDVLGGLEELTAPEPEDDSLDDVLDTIDTSFSETEASENTGMSDALASVEIKAGEEATEDNIEDVLAGLDAVEQAEDAGTGIDDILDSLEDVSKPVDENDDLDSILDGLDSASDDTAPEDDVEDILGGLDNVENEGSDIAIDDALSSIETTETSEEEEQDLDALLADLDAPEAEAEDGSLDDILADLNGPETTSEIDVEDDVLTGIEAEPAETPEESVDDILAELDAAPVGEEESVDDLDALLSDLSEGDDDVDLDELLDEIGPTETGANTDEASGDAKDDLDALLDSLGEEDGPEASVSEESEDEFDSLLADLDSDDNGVEDDTDLDALMADLEDDSESEGVEVPHEDGDDVDLDSLLADLDEDSADDGEDDLDALLADLDDSEETEEGDVDAILTDLDGEDEPLAAAAAPAVLKPKPQSPFGRISAPRPEREALHRPKFRMAVFGDFTGRAARGLMETGDDIAARKPIELDVDTVEEVIESFATTLTLPIGKDGAGIEVKLSELDDLHPDELYEKLELFEALTGLRQQLGVGSMADKAIEKLKAWSEEFATPVKIPKTSASTSVPSNLKLSDFQSLIGDSTGKLTQASPADDLIARVVGPHIVKAPDAGAAAMKDAVDEALSSAMRLVLHHPDFQAVEAQWRSLDFLARRIETDSDLQIVLYDVSAEELAADLAASEDLGESGLFKLLTDVLDPEEGAGGFSAMFGLYTFEETPPHAELLARIGQIGAHVDAPFFAAITPNYLDVTKEERHPLVAETWDKLRALPEAEYLGLASPRFLLRLPYGAKTDPTYEFDFEEFTPKEGLSGMLWANPVVAVAVLLAATRKKDGKAMDLGTVMSLGDLPFHYVTDRFGDQVALPCTERNLTSDPAQATLARGFMPVLWIKGRNEIRLGSFRALGGDEILGPWAGEVPAPRVTPNRPDIAVDMETDTAITEDDDTDMSDDLNFGDDDGDLDDLLAGFNTDDDEAGSDDEDDMDPELAALLEGL